MQNALMKKTLMKKALPTNTPTNNTRQ